MKADKETAWISRTIYTFPSTRTRAQAATGDTMSLVSFIEQAGEKLFSRPAAPPAATAATAQPDIAALNASAGQAIAKYIASQNLSAQGMDVKYDGASQTVTVAGIAADQATKEKIVLCCGNVAAVAKVDDQLTVAAAATPPSTYVTVKSGDTLSKISKDAYGDANAYKQIFEANQPMLSSPDRIYPGQLLRIPPKG
jgi:nucleoid-associated protein YgaU